jgi:hypothetical protein
VHMMIGSAALPSVVHAGSLPTESSCLARLLRVCSGCVSKMVSIEANLFTLYLRT